MSNWRLYKLYPKPDGSCPRKERWLSGLRHPIRNRTQGNTCRGFKSHPLRVGSTLVHVCYLQLELIKRSIVRSMCDFSHLVMQPFPLEVDSYEDESLGEEVKAEHDPDECECGEVKLCED